MNERRRSSEFDANISLAKRAELARTTAHYEEENPIGVFHGLYWSIWVWLVCGAVVYSLTSAL